MHSTFANQEHTLQRILACYAEGRAVSPPAPGLQAGANFYVELDKALNDKLPERQVRLIGKIDSFRSRGFQAVRERHYPLAEQCFARVAAWLDSPELLDETRLVCRTFLMQSASYLDYCCGDYKEARRKTLEGLHADDVLENRHGYEILLVHRLQFALNLVRISARTGRCGRAVALACRILVFLGTQPLAPPLPGQWNDAHLAALPAELVSKLCQQVVSELATLLVAVDPKQRERFWSILQPWLSRMLFQECCPRAYTWLRLKSALLAGDDRTFLELGLEYMRAGRSELPLLWYSTVFEILAFAKRQCLPGAQRMHAQVQLDSKTWQDLPDEWKLPA